MLLHFISIPFLGIFTISSIMTSKGIKSNLLQSFSLLVMVTNIALSLVLFILFDSSSKQFQFVQEQYGVGHYDVSTGIDGISMFFLLLTAIIIPISLVSNWKSIQDKLVTFLMIIFFLEISLLIVFIVIDSLMFYIFFESILAPLFIFIGLYGSNGKVRASFYFFLYTLWGSLFMLLSIVTMLSFIGSTEFALVFKSNFIYIAQFFLFIGIFIAFAVKTPTIYLNSWLLKAHVESPLSGSIILAGIVLKLSLYGIFRLILTILPKAFLYSTYVIFLVGVVTIWYASMSTIRTIDIKELIAYSSVSHAAVYFLGVFSNVIQGLQGSISLGLAHGFVSSGLFICAGGVLYDRSFTRLITYYRGVAQAMPLFCVLFFILCLGNCGVPLTLNFIGEFLSLYGVFERLPLAGVLASSSIVFSAGYTIFMYNRIAFGGSLRDFWEGYRPDINKREYVILLILVLFTVILGIYPSIIFDGLNYHLYSVIYSLDNDNLTMVTFILPFFKKYNYELDDFSFDALVDFRETLIYNQAAFNCLKTSIFIILCIILTKVFMKNIQDALDMYFFAYLSPSSMRYIPWILCFIFIIHTLSIQIILAEPAHAMVPYNPQMPISTDTEISAFMDSRGIPACPNFLDRVQYWNHMYCLKTGYGFNCFPSNILENRYMVQTIHPAFIERPHVVIAHGH